MCRSRLTLVQFLLAIALSMAASMVNVAATGTPVPLGGLPDVLAPYGLGSVMLPADRDAIGAVFDALPEVIAGEGQSPRVSSVDRIVVSYGETDSRFGSPLMLTALSFADGDFFPSDFTAGDFVSMTSQTDDYEATAFGREGDLVWIQSETTVSIGADTLGTPDASRVLHTLAWGEAGSLWLFAATAGSPDGLAPLVAAFAAAAGTQPG
ncbi:MAG: hypothetical protein H0V37_14780 [Chloroflexia bacterium]|nr:hypothetical protein [Chloroflexia bacterium]